MRKSVFYACVAVLAAGFGIGAYNYAVAQSGDMQSRILAGIKRDVDIDGDNIPDSISLMKSGQKGEYNIVGNLSKFRKQVVLSSIDPEYIEYIHVYTMNKNDNMGYLQKNRLLSDNEKRLIKINKSSNFVNVIYEESSAYIILITESGEPIKMFYSD